MRGASPTTGRKTPYDQGLMAIVLALLGFGLIMVFSASAVVSRELYDSQTWIFVRQLISVIVGLGALMLAMQFNYSFYSLRTVSYGLIFLSFTLLIYLLVVGPEGVRRWIHLGWVNFQPSELAKLAIIIFTARHLAIHGKQFNDFKTSIFLYLSVVAPLVFLILIEPDLGTALAISTTAGFLLFMGGLKYRYLLCVIGIAIPTLYLLVVRVPYRLNRILAFVDPDRDPYGIGYQIRQSLIAVGAGGWKGAGYAQSKQKLFFLPEPHTDFIYAVVGEELGLLGCMTLLVLFSLFFWRGVRISLRADSLFGTYLGLGIVTMIVLQAFINMSVTVSLLPTKGLPLPFVSVGGSSMVITLLAVGILLNISRVSSSNDRKFL